MSSEGYGGYFLGRGYFSDALGVGVMDPAERLDVAGTVQATGLKLTTAPAAGYVLTSDATGLGTWQPASGGGSSLWDVLPDDSIYYGDGYVGIGTGAGQPPEHQLHVIGTAAMTGLKLGDATTAGYVLTADASGYGTWQPAPGGGTTFWRDGPDDNIYFDDGFVGIGTQAPAHQLDVLGTIRSTSLRLGDSATPGYVLTADASGYGTWQPASGGGSSVWQVSGSDTYYDSGRVGIGTDAPTRPLHVVNTVGGATIVADNTGEGNYGELGGEYAGVWGEGHLAVQGTTAATTGKAIAGVAAAGTGVNYAVHGMTLSPEGYGGYFEGRGYFRDDVGIGVQNPTAKLDVSGMVKMTAFRLGESAVAGHVLTATSNGAGTWQALSPTFWDPGPDDDIVYTDGYVGIGLFDPLYPLDVNGTISADGLKLGDATTAGYVLTADANGVGTWQEVSASLWDGNGWGDIWCDNCQVGIGTDNPQKPLEVHGNGSSVISATNTSTYGQFTALHGVVESPDGHAVAGFAMSTESTDTPAAVYGKCYSPTGYGVHGLNLEGGYGIYGEAQNDTTGFAGYFEGRGYFSGNVGIGYNMDNPQEKLEVNGTVKMSGFRLGTYATPGHVLTAGADGVGTWQAPTGGSGGDFNLPYAGSVDADGQSALEITNTGTGTLTRAIEASITNAGSDLASAAHFSVSGGGSALTADSDTGVTVRVTSGGLGVDSQSSGSGGGDFRSSMNGGYGVRGKATSTGNSTSNRGGSFEAAGPNGRGVYAETTGTFGHAVHAVAGGGEGIGVYAEAPWTAVEARSPFNAAKFYGNLNVYEYGTTNRVFRVDDAAGTTTVKVLQIEGGADLAEPFDVAGGGATAEPGMLVSIDPDNVGKLVVSQSAYDCKVAGVISGAGGINPGMVMGQEGSIAHGEHPIALTGRVWTLCDASSAPIEPGDLLTTSDTPGHAMKAADSTRSQGAVIGKAMSRLARGERGLVLVLVNLQ
jgi:hypothetical protein